MAGRGSYRATLAAFTGVIVHKPAVRRIRPMHSLTKRGRQRLAWMEWHTSHGGNAALTCRHFGICRDTFYRWWRRYDPRDLSTLESKPTAPRRRREPATPLEVVHLVLRLRDANPEWSKYKLSVVARRDHGITVCASTCGRILTRYGRISERAAAKRRKAARNTRKRKPRELVAAMPGDLVQIDTKHLYWPGGVRRFHFVAIDVATRMKVTEVYTTASSLSAAAFLATVRQRFPFALSAVQTDNGSEYLGSFDAACTAARIAHFFSYPHCPKHNAIVERAIQTEIDEFHSMVEPLYDTGEFNDLLVAWDRFYNEIRPHQALGYLTPMAYYRHKTAASQPAARS